jgi:hypothetical protein
MTGTVPPQLLGPRMAVWAAFPFDNRLLTPVGSGTVLRADWAWAMAQWDRVARAGRVVRLVVVDQTYSLFDLTITGGLGQRAEAGARFDACRAVDQLLFGRVYAGGGKLPLGQVGQRFDDPLRPGRQVPGVMHQIDTWRRLYGDRIDGIYVDSGPTDCTDPAVPGAETVIPVNYGAYVSAIRMLGYRVFLQAAQYPDSQPDTPWLRRLGADFLELWEAGVSPYTLRFQARDACHPDRPGVVPDWWDPGPAFRWSRVHVINDCRNTEAMRTVANLAVGSRGAGTIWITLPRQDPNLGAGYDVLPPYWDDEVAFFESFLRRDEDARKDAKDGKDIPDQARKDDKDGKDVPDQAAKDDKDRKDVPDQAATDDKDRKDDKDGKDIPDKPKEDPEKPKEDSKEDADSKAFKDEQDKDHPSELVVLKDSEQMFKTLETAGPAGSAEAEPPPTGSVPDEDSYAGPGGNDRTAQGRTFIRGEERPAVGERVVADPPRDGED